MWKEAERELAETARLSPNETAVWSTLAQTRVAEKKLDDAAAAYATALALDPLDEEAAAGLGAALRAQGKLAEAEAALVNAVESNTKSPGAVEQPRRRAGRPRRVHAAVEAFEKALSIDTGFEVAKVNLARATELTTFEKAAS